MFWWTVIVTAFSTVAVRCSDGRAAAHLDRLPDDTEPRWYALSVAHDTDAVTFDGRVNISIAVKTSTSAIALHTKHLVLHEIDVTDEITDRPVAVDSWTYAEHLERVEISVDGHVLAGRRYTIRIRFTGVVRDDGTGFFKSVYENVSEGKRWISGTQFKTTQARSAFPCYDVPYYKTPFNISIKVKENEIAISNMPVLKTDYFDEYFGNGSVGYHRFKWVHFAQTPAMSTCSVAFFTGELEQLDTTRPRAINVYSHLGSLYQIEYTTKAAPGLLRAMEEYTGLPYSMPKLDLLAMPILGEGPVYSWGLTAYREKTLFVDLKTDTKTKVSATKAVVHAMANQWFGNYVTPARWDFAWLNEGLATYLEYFATGMVEPEWRLEHFFVIDKQRPAMDYDQNERRPLTTSVLMPGGVGYYAAERMLYDKAASIMMMLNDWVGEEAFKKAINAYLSRNQYTTVTPEQLWNAFDNALFDLTKSGLNGNSVGTVMKTWTEKAGYPVVNVKKVDKSLVLTQQRFTSGFDESNDTTKWFIRLSYTTNKDKNFDTKTAPTIWLNPLVNETVIPIDDDVEWYIFNIQSTGFYRVNYTEDNWLSLIKQLNDSSKDVHVLNRAQLIDDSFSLAKVGLLDYKIPLSFTEYLKNEDDIIPWFSAMDGLNCVLNRMRRFRYAYVDAKVLVSNLASTGFRMINELVTGQKSPQYPTNIGWNMLSAWACRLEEYVCYRKTIEYYQRWENGEEIPADIRDAAFCAGARKYYSSGSLDKLLYRYNNTKTYSEKRSVMNALACVDIQSILTYLTLILEDKCPIDPRDYEDFFDALSSTPNGITALNHFLHKHVSEVITHVKDGGNLATKIFSILVSKSSTKSEIEKASDMAYRSIIPDELRNQFVPWYKTEVEDNEKWYNNGGPETIWQYINPLTKGLPMDPSQEYTTLIPSVDDSSASSRSQNFATILQILALSVSVKLLVNII